MPAPVPSVRRSEPMAAAIAHANEIIVELREALADMEEIVELLEIAEVQKKDDEREIETLRRALSQLQRAREQIQQRPDRQRQERHRPPPAPSNPPPRPPARPQPGDERTQAPPP